MSVVQYVAASLLVGGLALAAIGQEGNSSMAQQVHSFEKTITVTRNVRLQYLSFVPKDYVAKKSEKFPLILFLHGAGERGSDIEVVKKHGIAKIVEQQPDFPFIAVSPQCPRESWWTSEVESLNALLDEVIANFRVDESRVYLTGLSMGGYGTWAWGAAYPKRFAALVPICGGGDPEKAASLKDTPIWVFHGAKDSVVPLEQSQRMVDALKAIGGSVEFTVYPEADHDSWTATYENPDLYAWLLKHSLGENR